jgi:hypothetical protein
MLAAGVARADDTGVYVGSGIGDTGQKSGAFESSALSLSAFGGYSFNRYFSAEAGYIRVADQTDRVDSLDVVVQSDGLYVAGLLKLPVTPYLSPYAKIGYVSYDSKTILTSGPDSISQSQDDEDLMYGLGCQLSSGEHFNLRFEYQKVDVTEGDFDILSVSAAWQF